MERDGDRSPRAGKPNSVGAPNKDLRAVFAPLVDYGDDSDEEEGEPESPGKSCKQDPYVCLIALIAFTRLGAGKDVTASVSSPSTRSRYVQYKSAAASGPLLALCMLSIM